MLPGPVPGFVELVIAFRRDAVYVVFSQFHRLNTSQGDSGEEKDLDEIG